MADSWLPKPEDYSPPNNGVPAARYAKPASAEVAADQPPDTLQQAEQTDATVGPYPPPPPTVSGDQVTESVYLGGITQ